MVFWKNKTKEEETRQRVSALLDAYKKYAEQFYIEYEKLKQSIKKGSVETQKISDYDKYLDEHINFLNNNKSELLKLVGSEKERYSVKIESELKTLREQKQWTHKQLTIANHVQMVDAVYVEKQKDDLDKKTKSEPKQKIDTKKKTKK